MFMNGSRNASGPSLADFFGVAALRPVVDAPANILLSRYPGGVRLGGLGAYTVWDVSNKGPQATAALDALDGAVSTLQRAASSGMSQIGASPDLAALQGQAQSFASWSASARAQVAQLVQQFGAGTPPNSVSFQQSDTAWNQLNAIAQQAQGNAATAQGLAQQVASIVATVQAAQVASQQAAALQQQQAAAAQAAQQVAATAQTTQGVTSALLQAQAMAAQGNFAGALAALQNPNVIAAAQATGRTGDIQAALASVTGQQSTVAKAEAALQQQMSLCSSKGGTWTGSACDMSAVVQQAAAQQSIQAQQLAQQQACMGAGGTWGANGCDMSLVIQSQRDAQAAQAQSSLAVQAAQQNAAAQARADQQAQLEYQAAQAQATADQQFRMAQFQADQQARAQLPSIIMSLLPLLATNPALAQTIIQILTGQSISLSGSVPGEASIGLDAGGATQQRAVAMTASMAKYADFGNESF